MSIIFQVVMFCLAKDRVSAPERRSFGRRKAVFWKAKGIILNHSELQIPVLRHVFICPMFVPCNR